MIGQRFTKLLHNNIVTVIFRRGNKEWRLKNGYPRNWTERGVLTDLPDYSYVDGRPTPYTNGQRARLLQQKEYATQIVELMNVVKYCKEAYKNNLKAQEEEKQKIINMKLRPKGRFLLRKKKLNV